MLLIGLVLAVWAYILYAFLSPEKMDVNSSIPIGSVHVKTSGAVNKETGENLSLMLRYRDPFLKKNNGAAEVVETVEEQMAAEKPEPPKPKVEWPELDYLGMVKNKHTQKVEVLVNIGEKTFIVQPMEQVADITVAECNKDSIQVIFQNNVKTLYLAQIKR